MPQPAEFVDCARADSLLEAQLDGELSQELARALESHLAGCPECLREARLARAIQAELRGLGELEPPARVREALQRTTRDPARSQRWRWLAAAAAVVLALLAVVLLERSPEPAGEPGDTRQVQQAVRDAKVALAIVASVQRRAGAELRDEAFASRLVQPTLERMLHPLHGVGIGGRRGVTAAGQGPATSTTDTAQRSL